MLYMNEEDKRLGLGTVKYVLIILPSQEVPIAVCYVWA